MWLSHLGEVQRNRKRGAAQAALTRKSKQQNLSTVQSIVSTSNSLLQSTVSVSNVEYFCGVCGKQYEDVTESVENWIACDKFDS